MALRDDVLFALICLCVSQSVRLCTSGDNMFLKYPSWCISPHIWHWCIWSKRRID